MTQVVTFYFAALDFLKTGPTLFVPPSSGWKRKNSKIKERASLQRANSVVAVFFLSSKKRTCRIHLSEPNPRPKSRFEQGPLQSRPQLRLCLFVPTRPFYHSVHETASPLESKTTLQLKKCGACATERTKKSSNFSPTEKKGLPARRYPRS